MTPTTKEMPDGLYYSERQLWGRAGMGEQVPPGTVHALLERIGRLRKALDDCRALSDERKPTDE